MKRLSLVASSLLAGALAVFAMPAKSADVGVSISIGQPGFYGQIDVGHVAPRVIYTRPMVIERRRGVVYDPVYLRVPPGHYKNWRAYCGRYAACGRPVYFVRDDWYNSVYVPYYRNNYRDGYYRDDYRNYDRNDRNWRDDRRDGRYDGRYDRYDRRDYRRDRN